ncbi:conserved exported hypothetical protein [Candidatus Sulfobium mesophilum]|uniref:Cell envelope protein n=1 Tax=Candidatus Sulfobium mesophilum TaxID=2016548 RepID=A0A2U3QI48_9BACT|nr:conserved exported hypothetical protein [Candidatus Sulfobium mesophilum]
MKTRLTKILAFMCAMAMLAALPAFAADEITTTEARTIAKDAYIYGFPLVESYRIQYAYFVDSNNPEFKAPWNQIRNIPYVYTPEDKVMQTPNSDTPYSMLGIDLRAEPMVLTVPAIEKSRYFSVQLIDACTHMVAYVGSRATGNDGGSFLIAGPRWKGETPKGIKNVFRMETDFAIAIFRTQLFNPGDLDNVKKVQTGYKAQSLSVFLGQTAPKTAPAIEFVRPLTPPEQKTSLEFFNVLNFTLQFCPTNPSERELMGRFSKIGVGSGRRLDLAKLSPEVQKAIADGMADAWKELDDFQKTSFATGGVTSGDLFGATAFQKTYYLYRFAGATYRIYAISNTEAMYPVYVVDSDGQKLDASTNSYTLRFAPGLLPPVNAFWSLTMYELPSRLLYANVLNRYLINSPMLPALRKDPDNGLTLYIQHDSPGKDKESNWLPAPNGSFMVILRMYWPKEEALAGGWKQPPMKRVGRSILLE